ncbi:hypothetical protein [Qipengyuania xiapuensis]|nr:hypothetical protein [Qipengyuania xiapuensis]
MTEPLGEARPEAKSKTQLAKGHLQGRPSLCEEAKERGRAPPGV